MNEFDLAASGDTWGISGPTFLRFYLAAAAVLVAVAVLHRIRLRTVGREGGRNPLDPQQAAYLNGGDTLTVHAALAGLRAVGAIDVGANHQLKATGPLPAGATPLDRAVHHAAGQRARVRELRRDQWVDRALTDLRAGLEQRGLLLSSARRTTARRASFALFALIAIGVVRTFVGLSDSRPVGYLFLSLLPLFVVFLFLSRVPRVSRAGRQALRDLRRQHAHLAPSSAPAYATYGAVGAATGVALFGAASLWALDPGFAEGAEIPRQAISDGGVGASGGDSGSGGDGGSCGGGSCGGGGGCGGGCGG
ncbi:TIGR04222 domain-containing membrane protein [Micromonospora musae]|uniref:TIGR04222 domain-containing membrane protein n=1 Tax=Micromonospora musae TaxID=1894970 RepID=A0A3A9YB67_9ACTN|nr:TIGR04222 domain-containing membrane protein [Micromonospora musae]RKN34480.1 TIGR04222 domain-containing membrane protein [Micromonospora musae]